MQMSFFRARSHLVPNTVPNSEPCLQLLFWAELVPTTTFKPPINIHPYHHMSTHLPFSTFTRPQAIQEASIPSWKKMWNFVLWNRRTDQFRSNLGLFWLAVVFQGLVKPQSSTSPSTQEPFTSEGKDWSFCFLHAKYVPYYWPIAGPVVWLIIRQLHMFRFSVPYKDQLC